MPRPSVMPSASFRTRFGRGCWLLAVLGALALGFSGDMLLEEREKLDTLRRQIDASWDDLEQELQAKVVRVTDLLDVVDRARLRIHGMDFPAVRNSLAGSARNLGGARNREERVEANLNLDRALRRFMDSLASGGAGAGGPRALPGLRRAQEDILAVEHRVALRRTAYNEAVQHFNTHLALFPANFAGAVFGIKRYPYYMPTNIRDIVQLPATPPGAPETEAKADKSAR
ncbi:MAG: LemA family protein [Bryobacterales bacterium]|nr:LemA family protein [Bryobacterales bacterium]